MCLCFTCAGKTRCVCRCMYVERKRDRERQEQRLRQREHLASIFIVVKNWLELSLLLLFVFFGMMHIKITAKDF